MAEIYNPWQQPSETNALSGEFATPEFYDMDEAMPELPMSETSEQLEIAMETIKQQADVIQQLVAAMNS